MCVCGWEMFKVTLLSRCLSGLVTIPGAFIPLGPAGVCGCGRLIQPVSGGRGGGDNGGKLAAASKGGHKKKLPRKGKRPAAACPDVRCVCAVEA